MARMTIGERLLSGIEGLRTARTRADANRGWQTIEPALQELSDRIGRSYTQDQRDQALQHARVQLWKGKCVAKEPGQATNWARTTLVHKLISLSRADRPRASKDPDAPPPPTFVSDDGIDQVPAPERDEDLDGQLDEWRRKSTDAREELLQAAALVFAGQRYAANKLEGLQQLFAYELDGQRETPPEGLSAKQLKTFQSQHAQRRKRARGYLAEVAAGATLSEAASGVVRELSAEAADGRLPGDESDEVASGSQP